MASNPRISKHLVDTKGYQDLDSPVILVSGEIGIYYINAEKLAQDGGEFNKYGNDSRAMIAHACRIADQNPVFGEVIDILASEAQSALLGAGPDVAVSGGQRRDWLFSGPAAKRLGVPHISCYKDGKLYAISDKTGDVYTDIGHPSVVHVADLLTKGSSCYDGRRTPPTGWIPTLRDAGADVSHVFAVVDRLQGGRANLRSIGVYVTAFVEIDEGFLGQCSRQPAIAVDYIRNPQAWSERYLVERGVEPFVAAFGPNKKDDRGVKFLAVYERTLRESGRWNELAERVQKEYGIDIETLPYKDVRTGDE